MHYKKPIYAFIATVLSIFPLLIILFFGMDFSPSYTAIFIFVGAILCVVGELAAHLSVLLKNNQKYVEWLQYPFVIFGMAFFVPAVIVYAMQDDILVGCVWFAAIGSVILSLVCIIITKSHKFGFSRILEGVEYFITALAALFAIACGTQSVALIPYGIGIAIILASKLVDGQTSVRKSLRLILFWSGIFLVTLLPIVPAIV